MYFLTNIIINSPIYQPTPDLEEYQPGPSSRQRFSLEGELRLGGKERKYRALTGEI